SLSGNAELRMLDLAADRLSYAPHVNERHASAQTGLSLAALGVCAVLALQGCSRFDTEPIYVRNALPERVSLAGNCTDDAIFLEPRQVGVAKTYPRQQTTCAVYDTTGIYLGCVVTPTRRKSDPLVLNRDALVHISDQKCQDWVHPGGP
ncbi:MAG: hypothetical protein ACXVX9_10765, partial [Mycobacteriaceae bacterium]